MSDSPRHDRHARYADGRTTVGPNSTSLRCVSFATSLSPRFMSGLCTTPMGEIGQSKNHLASGKLAYATPLNPVPPFCEFIFIFNVLGNMRCSLDRRERRL